MPEITDGHHRYLHWLLREFDGGYYDGAEDNRLPGTFASNCDEVISKIHGSLQSRPGQVVVNQTGFDGFVQGLYPYYNDNGSTQLMVAAGGNLGFYNIIGDQVTYIPIDTGFDLVAPVLFETCVNYAVVMNGVDTPKKWDGTALTALTNAPTKGQFPVLHKEKLFCVDSDEPSTLVFSDTFQPEVWPGVHAIQVKLGDGDEITALKKFIGELMIFKQRSTHTLKGTSLDDMQLQELDSSIGCVGPRAVTQHKLHLYVIGLDGIYRFNGMRYDNITSQAIPKLWSRVNRPRMYRAVAGVWDDLIWFSLPVDGSDSNNMVLIYQPKGEGGSWWPWSGIKASCFASYNTGTPAVYIIDVMYHYDIDKWETLHDQTTQQVIDTVSAAIPSAETKFYTGHSTEGRVMQQGVGRRDERIVEGGSPPFPMDPINAFWESIYFDFDLTAGEKKTKRAFLTVSQDTDSFNPSLKISKNYKDYEGLILERHDALVRQYRFEDRTRWRYMSVRLEENIPPDWVATTNYEVYNIAIAESSTDPSKESIWECKKDIAGDSGNDEPKDDSEHWIERGPHLGGFDVRGVLVPFKPKMKPKVRGGYDFSV